MTESTTSQEAILQKEKEETEKKLPRCIDFMWRWRKCSSIGNHFHHYYIYGEFPLCDIEKENMKRCFSHKFGNSEEDTQYLLNAAQEIKDKEENFTVKPSSSVWEFRENPAADWLKRETPIRDSQ